MRLYPRREEDLQPRIARRREPVQRADLRPLAQGNRETEITRLRPLPSMFQYSTNVLACQPPVPVLLWRLVQLEKDAVGTAWVDEHIASAVHIDEWFLTQKLGSGRPQPVH